MLSFIPIILIKTRDMFSMHRQPEQVMSFMLTKLGTSGSLDEENRLVIRGRFSPQSIEVLLQIYISEYIKLFINDCEQ